MGYSLSDLSASCEQILGALDRYPNPSRNRRRINRDDAHIRVTDAHIVDDTAVVPPMLDKRVSDEIRLDPP